MKLKNDLSKSKFTSDLIWNVGAFGGIVLIGILLNIVILKFYDSKTLGVFNQVYAIYILLSQLAVGGVHLSIQYFVPKYFSNKKHTSIFTVTALFSAFITSSIVILIAYLSLDLIADLMNSQYLKKGLTVALWGLIFFSFNKILLSVHNGLRNMKLFALFQLMRFIFLLLFLCILYFNKIEPEYLSSILALSELLLFIFLFFSLLSYFTLQINKRIKQVFYIQFQHGLKALTGNFLLDVNTKVDVILLGLFLSDSIVGIYSLAASVAEGFMQLSTIFRNNINPIITRLQSKKNQLLMEKTLNKSKINFYKIIVLLGIISMIVFPFIPYLFKMEESLMIILLYLILCGGFIISAGYQPFLMIFNQLGNPKVQTRFIFLVFLSNVVFNLCFIPIIGVYGAAVGTALSFVIQLFLTRYLLKKHYNLNF